MRTLQAVLESGIVRIGSRANADLEARILLQHVMGLSRESFLSRLEDPVPFPAEKVFMELIESRISGVPLAYLTGIREFWSFEFMVGPGVLIPRPETELIVEKALECPVDEGGRIVDIGTGCGCLALVLAHEFKHARVTGTDISRDALHWARANSERLGFSGVTFLPGDLFEPLVGRGLENNCDLIVSNPPYVSEAEWSGLPKEIRGHEPRKALVSGSTGLEMIDRLISGAGRFLRKGGRLIFEIGYDQAVPVSERLESGWSRIEVESDLAGIPRVFCAVKP